MSFVKEKSKLEKVRQSELGMFIKLIYEDTPIEEVLDMKDLAKRVSVNFDVECKAEDIKIFYALDTMDENYEVLSKMIYYEV